MLIATATVGLILLLSGLALKADARPARDPALSYDEGGFVYRLPIPDRTWTVAPRWTAPGAPGLGDAALDLAVSVGGDRDDALADLGPEARAQIIELQALGLRIEGQNLVLRGSLAVWKPAIGVRAQALAALLTPSAAGSLVDRLRRRADEDPSPGVRLAALRRLLVAHGDRVWVELRLDGVAGGRMALGVELATAAGDRAALLHQLGDRYEAESTRLRALAALAPSSLEELGRAAVAVVADGMPSSLVEALASLAERGVPSDLRVAARTRLAAGPVAGLVRLLAAARDPADCLGVAENLGLLSDEAALDYLPFLAESGPLTATGALRRYAAVRRSPALRLACSSALARLAERAPVDGVGALSVAAPEGGAVSLAAPGEGGLSVVARGSAAREG